MIGPDAKVREIWRPAIEEEGLTVNQSIRIGLLVFLLPAVVWAQVGPLSVGPISAQPGTTVSAMIEVPAGTDDGTQIPVSVIHGTRSGPVLSLIAANHGYEYPPVLALQRLRSIINPEQMA